LNCKHFHRGWARKPYRYRFKSSYGKPSLKGEVDDLLSKGLITKSLHDAAHEIRYFGNFGAHPRDDGLVNINDEDARQLLQLTADFLVDIYIRPHQTAELVKKRKEIP
jgi:hypothetical protein